MLPFKTRLRTLGCRPIAARLFASKPQSEPLPEAQSTEVLDENTSESLQGHIPPSQIPKPWTHKVRMDKRLLPNILNDEYVTLGNHDGSYARLYHYYKVGEIVANLPTLEEKIEFVNPHERPWRRDERKWHREWLRSLHAPRKAYCLPPTPAYFDVLEFYKYITKTAELKDSFQKFFGDLNLPTGAFENRATRSLLSILDEEDAADVSDLSPDAVDRLLRNILDDALMSLPEKASRFVNFRVSHNTRCESFWIRGGFADLYEREVIYEENKGKKFDRRNERRIIADCREKLGELAFTMRDSLAAQVRSKVALAPLQPYGSVASEDDLIDSFEPYTPSVFNLHADSEPLWQCPGYEPESGETHRYGRVAFKNVCALNERSAYWKMDEDEEVELRPELLKATAVSTLFNWNNGQAHCHGYTQYNDLDRPFVSQVILSDGKEFSFGIHQLNTLAINIKCPGFINKKANYLSFKTPLNLFDAFDAEKRKFSHEKDGGLVPGLNPEVLQCILRMLCV